MFTKIEVILIFIIAILIETTYPTDIPPIVSIDDVFDQSDIIGDHEFPAELDYTGETSLFGGVPQVPKPALSPIAGLPLTGPLTSPLVNGLKKPLAKAVCVLRGHGLTKGIIHLVQVAGGPTHISGKIFGLRPLMSHGFHFHERPAVGDCESAGEHFNPTNQNHGGPNDPTAHVGDLGNVEADLKGVSKVVKIDHKVSLIGKLSVIGRSLVVHTNTDDLGTGLNRESRKTGNSGGRLACCTVRFVNFIKG